jgi:hypothetical protein
VGSSRFLASRLYHWYDRSKRVAAYGLILLSGILLYFHELLGPWALNLLPATVGIFLVINFETLAGIEDTAHHADETRIFGNMLEAVPQLRQVIQSQREAVHIRIVAATGDTTLKYVLPPLLEACRSPLSIVDLYVIDPTGPLHTYFEPRWIQEAKEFTRQIERDYEHAAVAITVHQYLNLPLLHGISVNDARLVLGFAGWARDGAGPLLTAADRPHGYYAKGGCPDTDLIAAFCDWCTYSPSNLAYANERARSLVTR